MHFLSYLSGFFSRLGGCFLPIALSAINMDSNFDLQSLKGKKVGYYIGSFDPIHLGHQDVIDQSLKLGLVDYILIYPAPGGDIYKNRITLSYRQSMISSTYYDNPKVLCTTYSPKQLQDVFSKIAQDVEIIGIIGSDVVTEQFFGSDKIKNEKYLKVFMRGIPLKEKHFEDTIGALMALKADSFIVGLRGDVDLSFLNGFVKDRPVKAFISIEPRSSTSVRKAIAEKKKFEHLLSFNVQAIIKEKGLYGYSSRFNQDLQKELLKMVKHDQEVRISKKEENISKLDKGHTKRLKEIITQNGWPGVSLVGIEGSIAMWVLIQHQDHLPNFQKDCLTLLKKSADIKEARLQDYAYLLDRVNMNHSMPQIYGTQWKKENGKFSLYPVEDMENLDNRRLEVGLGPFIKYKPVY